MFEVREMQKRKNKMGLHYFTLNILKSQLEVFYVLTHNTESGKGSNLLLTAYILLVEPIVVGIELLALKEVSLSVGELIFLTDV